MVTRRRISGSRAVPVGISAGLIPAIPSDHTTEKRGHALAPPPLPPCSVCRRLLLVAPQLLLQPHLPFGELSLVALSDEPLLPRELLVGLYLSRLLPRHLSLVEDVVLPFPRLGLLEQLPDVPALGIRRDRCCLLLSRLLSPREGLELPVS